ncbi:hypothetical protein GCM10007972_18120 [Iodidimonas muriae]|uniref:Nucleotide modification associated domain-containing protein n=1 Tax=Iodidimonas muriae TaxID=261467 RepID=A0ABQ2LFT0_9PROT|nr:hypothetical protein [Iodidimonas muriae]GER07167.1 hypothetical protein JCM17843_14770 [Kordiimonadales bacterium JCM 17843]GGO12771.1 hypothetical protein GCM10007972_18120 [Iodidimonas muriae]
MKLHSYVVARDFGFAPNPFYGFCTLATCKPIIRRMAQIGDWVVGTGSKTRRRHGHMVFAMRVTETMTFDEFWGDPRFFLKRPNLAGSKKQAFGDNIYHRDPVLGAWCQENSHHSYADGCANQKNIANDTQTDRVLISDDYIYWGGSGPEIPERFRGSRGTDLCAGRGHKNRFPDLFVQGFIEWIRSQGEHGYVGTPLDWALSP